MKWIEIKTKFIAICKDMTGEEPSNEMLESLEQALQEFSEQEEYENHSMAIESLLEQFLAQLSLIVAELNKPDVDIQPSLHAQQATAQLMAFMNLFVEPETISLEDLKKYQRQFNANFKKKQAELEAYITPLILQLARAESDADRLGALELNNLSLFLKKSSVLSTDELSFIDSISFANIRENIDELAYIVSKYRLDDHGGLRKIMSYIELGYAIDKQRTKITYNHDSIKYLNFDSLNRIGHELAEFKLPGIIDIGNRVAEAGFGALLPTEITAMQRVTSGLRSYKFDGTAWNAAIADVKPSVETEFALDIIPGQRQWHQELKGLIKIMKATNSPTLASLTAQGPVRIASFYESGHALNPTYRSLFKIIEPLLDINNLRALLPAMLHLALRYSQDVEEKSPEDYARIFKIPKELLISMETILIKAFSFKIQVTKKDELIADLALLSLAERQEFVERNEKSRDPEIIIACTKAKEINRYVATQIEKFKRQIEKLDAVKLNKQLVKFVRQVEKLQGRIDKILDFCLYNELILVIKARLKELTSGIGKRA